MNANRPALDDRWFDRIIKHNAQLQKSLKLDISSSERRTFLANPQYARFDYHHLNVVAAESGLRYLESLTSEVLSSVDTHEVVVDLYLKKLEEKMLLLRLLLNIREAQQASGAGRGAAKASRDLIKKIFGEPRKDIFDQILGGLRQEMQNAKLTKESESPIGRLLDICRGDLTNSVRPFGSLPPLEIEDNSIYTSPELIKSRFQSELSRLHIYDWQVVINESEKKFRVLSPLKRINIPSEKALLARRPGSEITERNLRGLLAHEVQTHVLRSHNGENSALKLLSFGLAGYLKGEEGVATYREQRIIGAKDYAGADVYFALGAAFGLDRGNQVRTVDELIPILSDYYAFKYADYSERSWWRAFTMIKRIFISTAHNQTCPVYLTKDMVYREGNIAIYELLDQTQCSDEYLELGKFDPTDPDHVDALKRLNITM